MQQQVENWLRELGSRMVISTGDEQHEAVGMISPWQEAPYRYPEGQQAGVAEDGGAQCLFVTRYPISAANVERVTLGERRYEAFACGELFPCVYRARLQKEE